MLHFLTQSVTLGFRCCIRTNTHPVYVWKPFTPLFFAAHKKRNVSFQPPIRGYHSYLLFLTFCRLLFEAGPMQMLHFLTQSVTLGFRCCIHTNTRSIYVFKRWTPLFFAAHKKRNVSFQPPIRGYHSYLLFLTFCLGLLIPNLFDSSSSHTAISQHSINIRTYAAR